MKNYKQLVNYLIEKNLTISTAESCTGGLIAKLITDVSGSSQVFLGGVVSYSNEMKKKWLGVKQNTLIKFGAVSKETVSEMLDGITKETGSAIGVAVSGIAGPGGGTKDKPVGTVFLGIKFHEEKIIRRFNFPGSRDEVRIESAEQVLTLIDEICLSH